MGRVIADFKLFKADGAIQRSVSLPVTDSPGLLMSSRDEITRHTIEEARRMFPNAISFRFNTTIQQVDLNRQCVTTLTAGSKDTSKVEFQSHKPIKFVSIQSLFAKLTATLQHTLQA